jgi:flagellar hook-associated protein 3 FlgL
MNDTKQNIQKIQEQLTTQKKINRPSDGPVANARLMRLNSQIESIGTYSENIKNSLSFVEHSVSSMEGIQTEVQDVLVELTNLSDSSVNADLDNYADKIDNALKTIIDLSNTEFDGKFLFAGTDHSAKPYGFNAVNDAVELKISDNDGAHKIRISKNSTQKVNVTGKELFGDLDGTDIFNTLISIRDDLRNGIKPSQSDRQKVEEFNSHILNKISYMGTVSNKLTNTSQLLENQEVELLELRSEEQDVDMAKAIMELQTEQYGLDLSYKISSMILPKSLMDFL